MGITILAGILNKGKELGRLGKNFNSEIQAEIIVSTVNNYIREYSSACALNSSLGLERKYELAVGLAELKNFIARGLGLEQERKR
jgi:hypothetical protein